MGGEDAGAAAGTAGDGMVWITGPGTPRDAASQSAAPADGALFLSAAPAQDATVSDAGRARIPGPWDKWVPSAPNTASDATPRHSPSAGDAPSASSADGAALLSAAPAEDADVLWARALPRWRMSMWHRTQMCDFHVRFGDCRKGAHCPYAHSLAEMMHSREKGREPPGDAVRDRLSHPSWNKGVVHMVWRGRAKEGPQDAWSKATPLRRDASTGRVIPGRWGRGPIWGPWAPTYEAPGGHVGPSQGPGDGAS